MIWRLGYTLKCQCSVLPPVNRTCSETTPGWERFPYAETGVGVDSSPMLQLTNLCAKRTKLQECVWLWAGLKHRFNTLYQGWSLGLMSRNRNAFVLHLQQVCDVGLFSKCITVHKSAYKLGTFITTRWENQINNILKASAPAPPFSAHRYVNVSPPSPLISGLGLCRHAWAASFKAKPHVW